MANSSCNVIDIKAALYAIVNLQPFVVKGTTQAITDALYQNHSANYALDIENYSEEYLIDRAAMLQWWIKYNESDEAYENKIAPQFTFEQDKSKTYIELRKAA